MVMVLGHGMSEVIGGGGLGCVWAAGRLVRRRALG